MTPDASTIINQSQRMQSPFLCWAENLLLNLLQYLRFVSLMEHERLLSQEF